jgi:hypothetical protein
LGSSFLGDLDGGFGGQSGASTKVSSTCGW